MWKNVSPSLWNCQDYSGSEGEDQCSPVQALKFHQICMKQLFIFILRNNHGFPPETLSDPFHLLNDVISRSTRVDVPFYIIPPMLESTKKSIFYHGPTIWNSFDPTLQNVDILVRLQVAFQLLLSHELYLNSASWGNTTKILCVSHVVPLIFLLPYFHASCHLHYVLQNWCMYAIGHWCMFFSIQFSLITSMISKVPGGHHSSSNIYLQLSARLVND